MTHFAREYGNALFELAMEEGIEEEIHAQLKLLKDCFGASPEYIRLLCARNLEPAERKRLLDEAFGGSLHPYLLNYLKLLTERGAMNHFLECADVYRLRYNEEHGIVEATAVSAAPLTQEQAAALEQTLASMTGKRIVLHRKVNPELIGGMQVDLEGKRYDNSIRTRLDRLRRTLIESE